MGTIKSHSIMENKYTDLSGYDTFSVEPTVTASQWNTIYATYGAMSVTQGDNVNAIATVLDSAGTNAAGDILGQVITAPDVWNKISNIHHLSFWATRNNVTDDLIFRLLFPASYSGSTPTWPTGAAVGQALDVTTAFEYRNASQQYIEMDGAALFTTNAVEQRINVPLRYASHRTAMTTLSAAVTSATATTFDVANTANCIDNWNGLYGDSAVGEMVVIRKLTAGDDYGKEYRFMISGLAGSTITIVPNKYESTNGAIGTTFASGDEVYFPLTAGNKYMIIAYGDAANTIFTFYGRNNYPTYSGGNLYTSATGWDNLVSAGANYNMFFEVYSTPSYWALDTIEVNALNNTLLSGMDIEVVRSSNMLREDVSLVQRTSLPYNSTHVAFPMNKANTNAKFQFGDVGRIGLLSNAATTVSLTIGVNYTPFDQNTDLYVNRGSA